MINFSLQREHKLIHQPKRTEIAKWLKAALLKKYHSTSINISIVNLEISRNSNHQYRNKDYPTNIISLEFADTREQFNMLSGELILCDEIILQEAQQQNKDVLAHYAHMLVHGFLHLQGMNHVEEIEAEQMEYRETQILNKLGFKDPYQS